MDQKKGSLEDFVPFPKRIGGDLSAKKLQPNEFKVYCYIRIKTSPYGISTVSLEDIRNDLFNGRVSINYCNQIMLSLKRKRYLFYEGRSGHRGSFEVRNDEIFTPDKVVTNLEKYFSAGSIIDNELSDPFTESEVPTTSEDGNKRVDDIKKEITERLKGLGTSKRVRGYYTDT